MSCPNCERLQRLNEQLAERVFAASEVLSKVAEKNGLVKLGEVCRELVASFDAWSESPGWDNNEWDAVPAAIEKLRELLAIPDPQQP